MGGGSVAYQSLLLRPGHSAGPYSAQVVVGGAALELLPAREAFEHRPEGAPLSPPRGAHVPGHDAVSALVPVAVPAAAAEAFGSSPIRTTTSLWNSVDGESLCPWVETRVCG